jgi:ElaB/YqjD/DUF883 family membrane-anchored ribosome-binding protein
MEETNRVDTEKGQLRASLQNVIDKAQEVCQRLQDRTTAAAKATHSNILEHPYQAMGVAFGAGVLIGLLLSWRNRD